jgi:hypothetical protein
MAFFPFTFLFYLKTITENKLKPTLLFSFFFYLLFATSYPGEIIIIFYFLLAYFIIHALRHKNVLLKNIKFLILGFSIIILFSLPAIIAYGSGISFITRGSNVSLELSLTNSLNPVYLISYLFPWVSWKIPIAETDILGRNSFIGLLPFFLIILSFCVKSKTPLISFLKWMFIISLLLSLGKYGLLRSVFYYTLPLMDTFRHPSLFRFITTFSGCLLAAFMLQDILENRLDFSKRKIFFQSFLMICSLTCVVIIVTAPKSIASILPASFTVQTIKFNNTQLDNS